MTDRKHWFDTVDEVVAYYLEALNTLGSPPGVDWMAALGLDEPFDNLLRQGQQPCVPIDDILLIMVQTGSLRGARISLDAGADPYATDSSATLNPLNAIEKADLGGMTEMGRMLREHVASERYVDLMKIRMFNGYRTVYARPPAGPDNNPPPGPRLTP